MALTGYEKPLSEYSKSELVSIAKNYTIYYTSKSGEGKIGGYEKLTKPELINIIKNDRDYISFAKYQYESPKTRIETLKERIRGIIDPEDIMMEIISIFTETELIPEVGKYYTFIYNAKTPKIIYDQHPLIATLSIQNWGFTGLNFHWKKQRNYTWEEVAGYLHIVERDEIEYLKSIRYAKFIDKSRL
jgi:hypothetical protein